MKKIFSQIKKCRISDDKKLINLCNFGDITLTGVFPKDKKTKLKKTPLQVVFSNKSKLLQLKHNYNLNNLFGYNYGYRSSLNSSMKNHLYEKYTDLSKKIKLKKNDNILDIGSNDGTFLNFFSKKNFLLGMDPSINKFKKYYKKNIKTLNNFFSKKIINKNFNYQKKFNLIASFAIFYDIENPNSFCKDIYDLLDDNGIWILEMSYLPLMLKNLTYDQICHEHVTYYNLTVFNKIIKKNNLKLIDINLNEINGGSIEIICSRKTSIYKTNKKKILKILNDEKKINLQSYKNFNNRIEKIKKNLNKFLKINKKKTIIGYGASTKGNIVLNQCDIDNKRLPYICDANKYKHKKFTPGTNIEIITKDQMRAIKPDFLLVLIWSFRKEVILQEINYIKSGGSLVFLLPRLHIVNKLNYKKFFKKNFKSMSYKY